MLSKEEAKEWRIEFWGKLQKQMEKMRNSHGSKVNWMNYNTGVRHLYFRMEADDKGARLCIDLQFPDEGVREVYYEQFEAFKNILDNTFKDLQWHKEWDHWNGKRISRIVTERSDCSFLNQKDWDKMHLFLKLNFKKLDEFWCDFAEVFHNLK